MVSETYRFLEDIEELRWFYTYAMSPLRRNECWFLSTSARNKCLNEEERKLYQIGRSEMWKKEVVTEDSFDKLIRGIHRCETNKLAYTTKAGIPYPDKVLVLYLNIAPTDAYKAMCDQIDHLITIQRSLVDSVLKNGKTSADEVFYNIRRSHITGQSIFARTWGEKIWVDIDIDLEGYDTIQGHCAYSEVHEFLQRTIGLGNFIIVRTAGGLHYLLRRTALTAYARSIKSDPVINIIEAMTVLFKKEEPYINVKEIVKNINEMIPCVGSVQHGNHLVFVTNKEDFTPEEALHGI
jgi:hypothetical protein